MHFKPNSDTYIKGNIRSAAVFSPKDIYICSKVSMVVFSDKKLIFLYGEHLQFL